MNVNNNNFNLVYSQFEADINSCTFYAVDCEMSGIFCDPPDTHSNYSCSNLLHQYNTVCRQSSNYLDTPECRYAKLKQIADTFTIIQFGICIYTLVSTGGISPAYTCKPYNFYINRQQGSSISLQPTSIKFLRDCGLDFNEWIQHGINYCNSHIESQLQSQIDSYEFNIELYNQRHETRDKVIPTDPADIQLVNTALQSLNEWYMSDINTRTPTYEFIPMNGYHRLLIRQRITEQFHNQLTVTLRKPDRQSTPSRREQPRLMVSIMSADEYIAEQNRYKHELIDDMNKKLGFRRIYKLLCHCKKPIITHNGSLDITFMLSAFDQLPIYLHEFQLYYHTLFPVHYDTKTIVNQLIHTQQYQKNLQRLDELNNIDTTDITDVSTVEWISKQRFTDSSLGSIFSAISNESHGMSIEYADGFTRYTSDTTQSYAHEAAYDAYMTGYIFAILQHELSLSLTYTNTPINVQLIAQPHSIQSIMNISLQNTIPLGWSMFMLSLDPAQPNPCIQSGHKYHISNIQSDVRNDQILQSLFNDTDVHEFVQVRNISSTDALLIINHRTIRPNIHNSLNINVVPYEQYRQQFIELQQSAVTLLDQVNHDCEHRRGHKSKKRRHDRTDNHDNVEKKHKLCVIC